MYEVYPLPSDPFALMRDNVVVAILFTVPITLKFSTVVVSAYEVPRIIFDTSMTIRSMTDNSSAINSFCVRNLVGDFCCRIRFNVCSIIIDYIAKL